MSIPQILAAALPVLTAMGWIAGLHGRSLPGGGILGFRDSVLLGLLVVSLIATAGCWLASVAGVFASLFFVIWWTIWAVLGGLLAWNAWHEGTKPIRTRQGRLAWDEVLLVGILILVLSAAFLMAVLSPPNNADSQIYHLPRQVFWMAQGTVFTDQVSNPHMIKMPPLSEYLGVNLYLLSGSDRFHNLIQWVALGGCLLTISRILSFVGATRRAQLFGCVFFVSVPAVFFEASNTKNDLLTAFFLLGAVWSLTGAFVQRRFGWMDATFAGAFAGCALLTKGTAIAFLPVVAAGFLLAGIRKRMPMRLLPLGLAAGLTVLLAAPHFAAQSSKILASERGESSNHANAVIHPAAGLSVMVQNVALQLALPWASWNHEVEKVAAEFASAVGYPVNDPRTTFLGTQFAVAYHPGHEDRATAFVHWTLLILISAFGWIWVKAPLRSPMGMFSLGTILLILIFSLLFRWQPWHSRLLIPCMAIGSISVGIAVAASGRITTAGLALVFFAWLFPSLHNSHRPILGGRSLFLVRDDAILRNVDVPADIEASLNARAVFERLNPRRVGLYFSPGGVVYPVLRTVQRNDGRWPELELSRDADPDVWLVKSTQPTLRPDFVSPDWQCLPLGGAWALWTTPIRAESASNLVDPSAFDWRGEMRGVGPVQGPYPEYQLPAFRNLYAPQAVFDSEPTVLPTKLHLVMGAFSGPNRATVRLGEQVLGEFDVKDGGAPAEFRAILPPQSAAFSVIVDFAKGYPSDYDPAPVAARLFRINFIPLSPNP